MALNVADLQARLRLDTSGFTEGLKSAEAGTSKIKDRLELFADEMKARFKAAGAGVDDLTTKVNDVKEATRKAAEESNTLAKGMQAVASSFASVKLGGFVKELAETRARTEVLQIVMENVAKVNKVSADEATRAADAIKQLGITTQESRQSVTQFIQAQLDLEKATKLARVAQDAAVVSGENSSQAFQGLLHGILTLQPEVLRTRGIVVNLAAEFDKMAESLGKDTKELTGTEKQTAALNAVLAVGATLTGTYEAAMSKAGKQLTSLPRFIEEAKNALGGPLQEAFSLAIVSVTNFLKLIISAPEPVQKLVVGVTLFATAITGLAGAIAAAQLLALPAAFAALASPIGLVVVAIAALTAAVVVFLPEIKALFASISQSAAFKIFAEDVGAIVTAVKWKELIEAFKFAATEVKRFIEGIKSVGGAIAGMLDPLGDLIDRFGTAGEAMIKTFVEGIKRVANLPVEAVKGMLGKIRNLLPFSPAKEGPLADLDDAGLAFSTTFASGIDAGRRFVTGSVERLARDAEDALPARGLAEAFFQGFEDRARSANSALVRVKEAGRQVFEELRSGFSDILFEGIIDGIDGIEKAFKDFGKRLLRIFTDVFAQILVKQAALAFGFNVTTMAGVAFAGGGGGFEGGPNALGSPVGGGGGGGFGGFFGFGGGGNLFSGLSTMVSSWLFEFVGSMVSNLTGELLPGAIGQLGNFAPQIIGNIVPIIGVAISIITDLIKGNLRGAGLTAAGAIIGTWILPGIGTALGALIGKLIDIFIDLFADPPHAHLDVQLKSTFMDAQDDFMKGLVGSIGVFVSGAAIGFGSPEAHRIQQEIADALSALLRQLLGATLQAQTRLPASISETITGRLRDLATRSPMLDPAGNPAEELENGDFQRAIEALPNKLIKFFSEAVFGGLDIATLQRPGEALGDTFSRVLNSMVGLAGVMKALGMDADAFAATLGTGDEALRAYVTASLDFFDSFRVGTETFTKTAARVSAAVGGMQAIFQVAGQTMPDFGTDLEALTSFLTDSIAFFQGFTKEGEAFLDTVKRVVQGIVGLFQLSTGIEVKIAELTKDTALAMQIVVEQLARGQDAIVRLADQLTVAIESGGSPDEILTLAQTLFQARMQQFQAEVQLVQQLRTAVQALRVASVGALDFLGALAVQIVTFGGAGDVSISGPGDLQAFIRQAQTLFDRFATDVEIRIGVLGSLFSRTTELLQVMVESGATFDFLGELAGAITLVGQTIGTVLQQISEMEDPARAVASLQALDQVIVQGFEESIAVAHAYFAQQRQLAQDAADARLDALQTERDLIEQDFDTQRQALDDQKTLIQQDFDTFRAALQDQRTLLETRFNLERDALNQQIDLARKWASVLDSVENQLRDLFNLMAPTQPLTSLQTVQDQFRAAFSAFQAGPTPELADLVQTLAQQVIQLAQGVPGFDLPSLAFQGVVDEVTAALEAIRGVAEAQPDEQDLLAQLASLEAQQAASLDRLDASMRALNIDEQVALSDLDAQIEALNAAAQVALGAIDAQIVAVNQELQATLTALSQQEQAAVAQLEQQAVAMLDQIRVQLVDRLAQLQVQELEAAARLQEILGDRTFDEFIAVKQAEVVVQLQFLNDQIADFLAHLVLPGAAVPALQHGTPYVRRTGLAVVDEGEMVLPRGMAEGVRRGGTDREVTINFSPTIRVELRGNVSQSEAQRVLDQAMTTIVKGPSTTRSALLDLARRSK